MCGGNVLRCAMLEHNHQCLICNFDDAVDGAIRCLSLLADDLAEEQIMQVRLQTNSYAKLLRLR